MKSHSTIVRAIAIIGVIVLLLGALVPAFF